MGKGRLEAFSDGVIAIIITIMVLEMKVPHGAGWDDLAKLGPVFLSYVLSFVNVVNRSPGAFVMGRRGHSVWLPLEATKELMS